ncbi:MAG: biotin--acetyl-CoA-carboxylase ligase [Desulfovibrio sp.]|nr:biotin--acetyl-CoA-carboxylase ligase [Desulfovibrio sp.]
MPADGKIPATPDEALLPLARPMDEDDMQALFGAGFVPPSVRQDTASPLLHNPEYAGCALLRRECDGLGLEDRAALIFFSRGSVRGADRPQGADMPEACFLAGSCSSAFHPAWRLSREGLLPVWGSVLVSRQETGYGQFRRAWHSPRGNLHVCFRLPADGLFRGDAAAIALGLLVCGVFRKMGFPLSLKWPNDLLVDQRAKAGGMLVEERDGIVIAGLGVNTAEAPKEELLRGGRALPAAVLPYPDAPGSAGSAVAPFYLWRILLSGIIVACGAGAGKRTLPELVGESAHLLAWTGRKATMEDGGHAPVAGRILGCGPGGGLLLRPDNGSIQEIFTGSLSLPFL